MRKIYGQSIVNVLKSYFLSLLLKNNKQWDKVTAENHGPYLLIINAIKSTEHKFCIRQKCEVFNYKTIYLHSVHLIVFIINKYGLGLHVFLYV